MARAIKESRRLYRVQEFAALTGVTVRALHHYDRLGLLSPHRTEAGYRLYRASDLERLEQVVALKFVGLSLKQIRTLLDRDVSDLPGALRRQRRVLEEKRRLVDRAIGAIREAEAALRSGSRPHAAVLKKIIEVIEMQGNTDWMSKYSSDAAKAKIAVRKAEWTPELQERVSKQWTELFADVEASLGEDPASAKAQALLDRWNTLVEGFTRRDPDLIESVKNVWADRANWPADFQEQAKPFTNKNVWAYMDRVRAARK